MVVVEKECVIERKICIHDVVKPLLCESVYVSPKRGRVAMT